MTIATLPAQITAGGGRGLVVGLSRRGIESLTGFRAVQPLSGMRCLSPRRLRRRHAPRSWLGRGDRAHRRRAEGRPHRPRGPVRAPAPGQRVGLARARAPRRPVPRRLAGARPARLAAVASRLTGSTRSSWVSRSPCSSSSAPPVPNAAQPDLLPRGWAPGSLVPVTLGPGAVTAVLWTAYVVGGCRRAGAGCGRTAPALRTWAVPAAARGAGPGSRRRSARRTTSTTSRTAASSSVVVTRGSRPRSNGPVGRTRSRAGSRSRGRPSPASTGPFGTLLHGLAALVGGDSLRQGVWVWQVLVVLAWLVVRAALRRVLAADLHGRVDVLWTLNPLVLGVGVLGAHIDIVAAALVVLAVAAAALRPDAVGAALAGASRRSRLDEAHVCRRRGGRRRRVVGGRAPLGGARAARGRARSRAVRRRRRRAARLGRPARLRPARAVTTGRVARDPVAAGARVGAGHGG